jgi:hypothetical protein
MLGGKSLQAADRRWEKELKSGHSVTIDDLGLAGRESRRELDVCVVIARECH